MEIDTSFFCFFFLPIDIIIISSESEEDSVYDGAVPGANR